MLVDDSVEPTQNFDSFRAQLNMSFMEVIIRAVPMGMQPVRLNRGPNF